MAKNKPAPNKPAAKGQTVLNWTNESARVIELAKGMPGSRGNALHRVGAYLAEDSAGAKLLQQAAGDAGAQAFAEQPRNVLVKLPRLAGCIAAGTPWCDAHALSVEGRKKADASIAASVAAIVSCDGMSERQKGVIAMCKARYPGGAGAQMPASMEALAFMGLVERKAGSVRNAEYVVLNEKACRALLPQA